MTTNPRKRPAATQEEAWVADEDRFVLQQAKKKAALRVKAGRGRPIDLLAVALRIIDPARNGFDEDDEDDDQLAVNPETVFDGMTPDQLHDLEREVDTYLALERNKANHEYWKTMKLVCRDRRQAADDRAGGRGISSVAKDLDRLLGPKNLKELESLEKQVKHKLGSDEAIDVDYWESLLKRLGVHKARAQLHKVAKEVVGARARRHREEQARAAELFVKGLGTATEQGATSDPTTLNLASLDPDSSLKVPVAEKGLPVISHTTFTDCIDDERRVIIRAGFIVGRSNTLHKDSSSSFPGQDRDQGQVSGNAYDREVARGLGEDEEVFAAEEEVAATRKPEWADKYVARKPRYFNRVQLGFEWNKYNQTHYDQDNPPPKVVQGYRFNIFYPDLVDKTKAPTYRIERKDGRKRGQTFAPAGEEDMCVIRFTAGAPYEDIAFRIVDREWDYSAKRERGFKSSFDKGMLQLHFQFRKIYYRK